MTSSGADSSCTSDLIRGPATVSSSSSLEDVDNINLLPPTADPLSVLPTNNNFEHFTNPASVSPAPTPLPFPETSALPLVTNGFVTTVSSAPSSSILMRTGQVPIMPSIPSAGVQTVAAPVANNNTVAEFLYQLTKMLTDNNSEVIEWANGKIEVHNPHKLASDVLHKYFRHSKFASFQRQLNYFGFRKLAGKGKMAPCSYVNDSTTSDLRSLLLIKRKTSATPSKDKHGRKRERSESHTEVSVQGICDSGEMSAAAVNPVLAGILQQNISPQPKKTSPNASTVARIAVGKGVKHQLNGYLKRPGETTSSSNSHIALAQAAVGKGVRHGYTSGTTSTQKIKSGGATAALSIMNMTFPDPPQLDGQDIQSSLSELTNNYRNSLGDGTSSPISRVGTGSSASSESFGAPLVLGGMLSRDSSLVDLAMLPPVTSVDPTPVSELANSPMPFVDFPHEDLDPQINGGGTHNTPNI